MVETSVRDYVLMDSLGHGAFGTVRKAVHRKRHEEVAIKIEDKATSKNQLLVAEQETLRLLQGPGIPKYIDFFTNGDSTFLVTELLGPNLHTRFVRCGRRFSDKTVLMIADQALSRIEHMHKKTFVHRDIKPGNFVTGLGESENQLYLIDFGLAKKFFNESCGLHIPYKEDKPFTGTLEFASRNCHFGVQMSRRDDLESMMYMIIYLFKGELPWQGLRGDRKEDRDAKVRMQKTLYTPEELTEGLPSEIRKMLKYVLKLKFGETPNYDRIRTWIRDAAHAMDISFDWVFDWMAGNKKLRRKSTLEQGFVQSVDTAKKRHSMRSSTVNMKNMRRKKERAGTTFDRKGMIPFLDGFSGDRVRSCQFSMTELPEQPSGHQSECDEHESEHLTIKKALGPHFKDRNKIMQAAARSVTDSNCGVF